MFFISPFFSKSPPWESSSFSWFVSCSNLKCKVHIHGTNRLYFCFWRIQPSSAMASESTNRCRYYKGLFGMLFRKGKQDRSWRKQHKSTKGYISNEGCVINHVSDDPSTRETAAICLNRYNTYGNINKNENKKTQRMRRETSGGIV